MVKTKSSGVEAENGGKSTEIVPASNSSTGAAASQDNDNISTRVGTRTKKAKVVFDPSDHYVPRKRVRKTEINPAESSGVSTTASKLNDNIPKSPLKTDKAGEVSSGSKSRLTLSPAVIPPKNSIISTYKPKVFGPSSPPEGSSRLHATSSGNGAIRKQEFKREPVCDMCHKAEQQRRGFKLIDCSNCAFRAHSKCLCAHPVYSKFPIKPNFRCFQCIECVVCGKSLRGGNLLFCCDCQNAFHQNCHGPSTSMNDKNSNGRWICKRCTDERSTTKQSSLRPPEKRPAALQHVEPEMQEAADDEGYQEFAGFSDNEIRKDSFSLSDGTINEGCNSLEKIKIESSDSRNYSNADTDNKEETIQPKQNLDPRLDNFENVENWTCDDVFQYFQYYFPEYAHLFKEQEIDGPSLVLMRKSDVVTGFGLKLGPAISLYQRIVMIQNNDRDFRLTWL
ncbi:zinc finger protein dpff-1 [Sabethes cyaneus]|uniref:zinc finger protein dpff-1 n=1 Tax=Sabethes cyaneus TaxID=53552 RepID=UPI00237DB1D6|nr:zinc finger protein dpff-1 [Sabethes cyaneus]